MAVAGHSAGHYVRSFSVREVCPEATYGTLVGAEEDFTVLWTSAFTTNARGRLALAFVVQRGLHLRNPYNSALFSHYQRPGSRNQANTLGIVDLPDGYMSSQSANEAAGLQSLDFSGNLVLDYAISLGDRRSVTRFFCV